MAIEALRADPAIGPHVQKDQFLHVAGVAGGGGLELLEPWLMGLLHRVLVNPGLERSQWDREINRFLDVLRVDGGTIPCTIRAALVGFTLQDTGFELADGAVVRPAMETDFHVPIGRQAPDGVVFEYGADLPAFVGPVGERFPDDEVVRAETAHQTRLTRLLLAMALRTEAPVQEQLVMKHVDFVGGGGGHIPDQAGSIARGYHYRLDHLHIARLEDCYERLEGKDLSQLGVATRRYLLARTERVRPTDQIIDYAIALESMTKAGGGEQQGAELAQLLANEDRKRKTIECDHKRFRDVRNQIVHDGLIPAASEEAAAAGRELVRESLLARAGLSG